MKKVSIIIPVYNTKKYLKRCLDSVKNQTYKNLEIICVDDGSTDSSEIIVDDYAKLDDRFIVIHKENGGESSARNTGLQVSSGDYIGFMDCDDWIELDMYEVLVNSIEKYNVDMAAASWFKSYDDKEISMVNNKTVKSGIIDRDWLLQYIYERDAYQGFAYMWDKLYKRDILTKDNNILLFDEQLKLGGDVLYLAQAAINAKSAVYIPRCMYHYYQRNTSGCHTVDLNKRTDWLKAYFKVIELFENNKVSGDILSYVKRFLAYHTSNVAELAYNQEDVQVLRYCQNIMKKYENEYISLNVQYPERVKRYKDIESRKLEGYEMEE